MKHFPFGLLARFFKGKHHTPHWLQLHPLVFVLICDAAPLQVLLLLTDSSIEGKVLAMQQLIPPCCPETSGTHLLSSPGIHHDTIRTRSAKLENLVPSLFKLHPEIKKAVAHPCTVKSESVHAMTVRAPPGNFQRSIWLC